MSAMMRAVGRSVTCYPRTTKTNERRGVVVCPDEPEQYGPKGYCSLTQPLSPVPAPGTAAHAPSFSFSAACCSMCTIAAHTTL